MEPIMKKLNLLAYPVVALLSLVAASAAFADDMTPDNTAATPSLKTQAQVREELFQARANGSIKVWSTSYNQFTGMKTVKTRAEVRAERSYGFDQAMYGEDSGSFALARKQPARVVPALFAASTK